MYMEYVTFGGTTECKSPKMGFKKVKVQPSGSKCNGRGMLVPITRLKLTLDEDAAFADYFVPGV